MTVPPINHQKNSIMKLPPPQQQQANLMKLSPPQQQQANLLRKWTLVGLPSRAPFYRPTIPDSMLFSLVWPLKSTRLAIIMVETHQKVVVVYTLTSVMTRWMKVLYSYQECRLP